MVDDELNGYPVAFKEYYKNKKHASGRGVHKDFYTYYNSHYEELKNIYDTCDYSKTSFTVCRNKETKELLIFTISAGCLGSSRQFITINKLDEMIELAQKAALDIQDNPKGYEKKVLEWHIKGAETYLGILHKVKNVFVSYQ